MTGMPYIVRISVPTEEFRTRLTAVPEARLLRELAPGRVVVTVPDQAAALRLAALAGVEAVLPDRLQPPTAQ